MTRHKKFSSNSVESQYINVIHLENLVRKCRSVNQIKTCKTVKSKFAEQWLRNFIYFKVLKCCLYVYMYECFVCMLVHVPHACPIHKEARRVCWIPATRDSCEPPWNAEKWIPWCSSRAARALNCWPSLWPWHIHFIYNNALLEKANNFQKRGFMCFKKAGNIN